MRQQRMFMGISPADDDHVLTAWLGNELQQEAFSSLYSGATVMENCKDKALIGDWSKLLSSDHFYYMSMKHINNKGMHQLCSPYGSPYDAFMNYMNVLSDFLIRVKEYGHSYALTDHPH